MPSCTSQSSKEITGLLRTWQKEMEDQGWTELTSGWKIYADKEQLIRVFTNLIKNGIQAIPDRRQGKIKVIVEQVEESYLVKIVDNGCGIPEAMQPKIFQPNFTTKSSGMGLGLSMVKSMLISNNATIYFKTKEDFGTEFVIEIPVYSNE